MLVPYHHHPNFIVCSRERPGTSCAPPAFGASLLCCNCSRVTIDALRCQSIDTLPNTCWDVTFFSSGYSAVVLRMMPCEIFLALNFTHLSKEVYTLSLHFKTSAGMVPCFVSSQFAVTELCKLRRSCQRLHQRVTSRRSSAWSTAWRTWIRTSE